jgi:CD151 antigen
MSSTSAKKNIRSTGNTKGFCSVFGIKAAIIIVGFILLVAVLSLFYLSAWTIVTKHKYALLASAYLYATSTYLLLISASMTSLAIIALFLTAWIEHRKGLRLTLCVLILTFVFEISAGLLAFGYTVHLDERLSKNLLETIQNKYLYNEGKTKTFDQMQRRFRCCGSKSFKDWQLNSNFNLSMASAVPDSCCKSYEPKCAQKPYGKHPSNIFYEGCSLALYRFYHTHLVTLGCVTVGVAFLQIFIIILLVWLIKRIQKLTTSNHSVTPPTKARRLSNEITYYPIQSSPSVK